MQNTIRLLYVIHSMTNGGAETLAIRLAEKLDKKSFSAAVCSLSDEGPLRAVLEEKNVPYFTMTKKEGIDLPLIARLRSEIGRRGFDIVHTHNMGPLLYVSLGSFLGKRFKLVHTEHINMDRETSYSRKHRLYNRILYRKLDGFVSIAEHLSRYFCKTYDFSKVRVKTIKNSVPLSKPPEKTLYHLREDLGVSEQTHIIGNISALRPQKDHATLLRAMKIVLRESPNSVLIIAGDGELKEKLINMAEELGINEYVKFLGYRSDVDSLLTQFDIFVLSSLYEGLPLCILEAMASAKPIVATNAEGIAELIENGKTGYIINMKSDKELASAILKLINNKEISYNMGLLAQKVVKKQFDFYTMIRSYEDYYFNIL